MGVVCVIQSSSCTAKRKIQIHFILFLITQMAQIWSTLALIELSEKSHLARKEPLWNFTGAVRQIRWIIFYIILILNHVMMHFFVCAGISACEISFFKMQMFSDDLWARSSLPVTLTYCILTSLRPSSFSTLVQRMPSATPVKPQAPSVRRMRKRRCVLVCVCVWKKMGRCQHTNSSFVHLSIKNSAAALS